MSLIDLRTLMSEPMYWEVHQFICETRDGEVPTVERHAISRDGYADSGRYFGTLQPGERLYRLDGAHRTLYVRTCANIRQLRKAISRQGRVGQ